MKTYALLLILPLILLIGVGNFVPKNYISYSNVTETYIHYLPVQGAGLENAYEYVVNSSRNSSLVVRIFNYQNYTDALSVYNYFHELKSRQATALVPYSQLNKKFNFSSIGMLENYSEFIDFNATLMENFSTLDILVSNSAWNSTRIGKEVNLFSSPASMQTVVTETNPIIATTTISAPLIPATYGMAYVLIVIVVAVPWFWLRPTPLTKDTPGSARAPKVLCMTSSRSASAAWKRQIRTLMQLHISAKTSLLFSLTSPCSERR